MDQLNLRQTLAVAATDRKRRQVRARQLQVSVERCCSNQCARGRRGFQWLQLWKFGQGQSPCTRTWS